MIKTLRYFAQIIHCSINSNNQYKKNPSKNLISPLLLQIITNSHYDISHNLYILIFYIIFNHSQSRYMAWKLRQFQSVYIISYDFTLRRLHPAQIVLSINISNARGVVFRLWFNPRRYYWVTTSQARVSTPAAGRKPLLARLIG